MKVEYDVPSGMKEMIDNVINAMVVSYFKAKGKQAVDNAELPIPTESEVIYYVVTNGYKNRIDAMKFYRDMDKRSWQDRSGQRVRNWRKLLEYSVQHGDYAGVTEDPNAPPPPLPETVRR